MTQRFGVSAYSPEIQQNFSDDIIYDLSKVPNWITIPYIKNGLYDRLQENFRQYKNEPLLIDQDEYQWFRRPNVHGINYHITSMVRLLKPNAYTETAELVIYDSAVDVFISAATWIANNKTVKPMKILKHVWNKVGPGTFKCETCGTLGRGKFYTPNHMRVKSAICPDQLLTCEEKIVQDIVV
jgi:hypothetical protein